MAGHEAFALAGGKCKAVQGLNSLQAFREHGVEDVLKEEDLTQFTGSVHWYMHWTRQMQYTDGVHCVAEKGKAYWLVDAIASYQPQLRRIPFQVWELAVKENKGLLTMAEDIGSSLRVRQPIPFTDFPLEKIRFYVVDRVLMLPSEY